MYKMMKYSIRSLNCLTADLKVKKVDTNIVIGLFVKKVRFIFILLFSLITIISQADDVNVIDFGADPDGKILSTKAIQKAIDHSARTGGGTVTVPVGSYLTKTVFLKSNVNLCIKKGATLLGDTNPEGFTHAIVYADNIKDAAITGQGTIDSQGRHYATTKDVDWRLAKMKPIPGISRHNNIRLFRCKNMRVKDVTLVNSTVWTLRILQCDGVIVEGVRIYAFSNENNDGINIDGKNITISDCIVDCDDDAMCFKSDSPDYVTKNVSITNCVLASNCNAIKFGTSSHGGFKNITVSNCVIRRPSEAAIRAWGKIKGVTSDTTVISGIALEIVDGGIMDQVNISNISMTGVQTPLFIRLGNRSGKGVLKNVVISNITATNESLITSSITGIPGSYVENVIVKDIIFNYKGTGTIKEATSPVPEEISSYPENRMFGYSLPAYGLYVRHVKDLSLENFRFNLNAPDARPAIILDDCHNIRLNKFDVDTPKNNQSLVKCIQSTNVTISGYQSIKPVPNFLMVEGEQSKDIKLMGNDFTGVNNIVGFDKGSDQSAVRMLNNFSNN